MQPDLEDVLHHAAVKVFLGGKVVMQVRLRQPRHVGDQLHRRPPEPGFGKDLFRGLQDHPFVLAPDIRAARPLAARILGNIVHGHRWKLLTGWSGCGRVSSDHTVRKRFAASNVRSGPGERPPAGREDDASTGENLRINPARLWDSLEEMALIGPGVAGGCNRQTLTDADSEGRHLFQRWCQAAGMSMGVDTMGNMFATRAGTDLTRCRSTWARTWIPSRPAGSMTASLAFWARWRWCGP